MPAHAETTHLPTQWPEDGLVQLPESRVVAQAVLERAEPLRDDADFRREFYGPMGIREVEPRPVEPINGSPAYIWDETVQPSGSYKSNGASLAVLRLPEDTERIVTFSTGNHGTSVAIAGKRKGKSVQVATTADIVAVKEQKLKAAGATLVKEDPRTGQPHAKFREAELTARYLQDSTGAALIEPFGNLDVVAGQCKVGFEMVEKIIGLGLANETIVIPAGVAGGGHISGIAIPVWEAKQQGRLGPNIHVVAVQPEGANALDRALTCLKLGRAAVGLFGPKGPSKNCDALAITEESLSPLTAAIVNAPEFVSGRYVVDDVAIGIAMNELQKILGHPVEPAAALPYAVAMLHIGEPLTFVLPVSGRNVTSDTLQMYRQIVRENEMKTYKPLAHERRKNFAIMSDEHLRRPAWGIDEVLTRQLGSASLTPGKAEKTAAGGRSRRRSRR